MNRIVSIILVLSLAITLFTGEGILAEDKVTVADYHNISDHDLLDYLESEVYDHLIDDLDSEQYFVENVNAIYISQEYLDELAYNSKSNIFFGYTLAELDEEFQGTRYAFTLNEEGLTEVKELEEIEDTTFQQIFENVAIGTGVILICVTISVTTGGTAPAISAIFAASAETGTTMALSSGLISGISAGIVKGIETNNVEEALKAAALQGSNGFKWGAITGAISGGVTEAQELRGATLNGLTLDEAARIQKESKYPLDVIKEFETMEQYQICKDAGIYPELLEGKTALVREIDLNYVDEFGRSNIQRIQEHIAPLDPSGVPYELHHVGQKADSTLAILTKSEHRLGNNYNIWHEVLEPGEGVHKQITNATWNKERADFWMAYLKEIAGVIN